MSLMKNTLPASLRKPVEPARLDQGLTVFTSVSAHPASPEFRARSVAKSRFARLPEEPEDARMTGVTRSLNRRLLALNVPGSLRMSPQELIQTGKIA